MLFLLLRSLRSRWPECLLAGALVSLVIATLTVQRSLSMSTEEQIHDLAHQLGKNMLVVPSETDLASFYGMSYGKAHMPDTYPARIQGSELAPHIRSIQSRLYENLEIEEVPIVLVGQADIENGRRSRSVPSREVLLGKSASSRLGLDRLDGLEVNGLPLTVDEVLRTPPDGLETGVFASLETAQEVLDRPGEINAMRLAGCWCRLDVPALASQVEHLLPGTRAITIAGMVKAQKGTIAETKRYAVVTLVVAILLIAGVVVALISSQVRAQIREIGLLMVTGAPPWVIVQLFVLKAAVVGALGALAGHLLGSPLTAEIASRMIGLPLPVPEGLLGTTLALSIAVSGLSALVPAMRASRLDPTEVLREI